MELLARPVTERNHCRCLWLAQCGQHPSDVAFSDRGGCGSLPRVPAIRGCHVSDMKSLRLYHPGQLTWRFAPVCRIGNSQSYE